jgi:hypothetical protein
MLLRVMDSLAKLGAVAVMIAVALSRSAALSLNIGNPLRDGDEYYVEYAGDRGLGLLLGPDF